MPWTFYFKKFGWAPFTDEANAAINTALSQEAPPQTFDFTHTWYKGKKEMQTNYTLDFVAKTQINADQQPNGTVRRINAWWDDDPKHEFDFATWAAGIWPRGQRSGQENDRNGNGAPQDQPPGGADAWSSGGNANGQPPGDWGAWSRGGQANDNKQEAQVSTGTHDDGAPQHGGAPHDDGGRPVPRSEVESPRTTSYWGDGNDPASGSDLPQAPPPPPPPQAPPPPARFPWPFGKLW